MREIIATNRPFTKEVWERDRARDVFRDKGEMFKVELVDAIPEDQDLEDLFPGRLVRPLPRPAHALDGRSSATPSSCKLAGAYWRGDQNRQQLQRIYGTAWAVEGGPRRLPPHDRGGREARPPADRPRDGAVPSAGGSAGPGVLASEGLGDLALARLHAPPSRQGRLPGESARSCSTASSGRLPGTGRSSASRCSWPRSRKRAARTIVAEADELPRPRADLQPGHQVLPRSAAPPRRVRRAIATSRPARCTGSCACAGSCRTTRTSSAARTRSREEGVEFCALLASVYRDLGFETFRIKFSDRPDEARRFGRGVGSGRGGADGGDPRRRLRGRAQSGRGRVLRSEARICADRCDRPRLAMRHIPGGLRAAGAARRDLCRRGRRAASSR